MKSVENFSSDKGREEPTFLTILSSSIDGGAKGTAIKSFSASSRFPLDGDRIGPNVNKEAGKLDNELELETVGRNLFARRNRLITSTGDASFHSSGIFYRIFLALTLIKIRIKKEKKEIWSNKIRGRVERDAISHASFPAKWNKKVMIRRAK